MNYRHAFHAGNFADVMKHALLLLLLRALARKATPFRVLDSHAGIGAYDLTDDPAIRTGEWQHGIARVAPLTDGPLADYAARIRAAGFPPRYPGSPALARALLRPQDRLTLCELHPDDHATLRRRFAGDGQVAVHRRDAWEAVTALTPFPEKRGLVLLDPPFEQAGEFERITTAIATLHRRFRAAIIAAWYPIKHRAPTRAFHAALRDAAVPDILAAELLLREPTDPQRLNGSGLIIVNPPYRFEAAAEPLLAALAHHLGTGEPGAGHCLIRLADE